MLMLGLETRRISNIANSEPFFALEVSNGDAQGNQEHGHDNPEVIVLSSKRQKCSVHSKELGDER